MAQIEEEDKKKILYTFWRTVPLIKRINNEKYLVVKQPTRSAIIEMLRTGIKDEKSENNLRFALNAHEIQQHLNEQGIKTSLQNVYFHLNNLLDGGLIKEIAIIKEGRFNRRYYGRTAKLFLDVFFKEANNIDIKIDENKTKILNLIKASNSNREPKNAEEIVESFLKERYALYAEIDDKLDKWFKNNAESLIDFNIDVLQTYHFLQNFVLTGKDTTTLQDLTSLLKI